ncbi:MAG TPA: hypothetical protein VGM25_02785 [Caulobacteraceae bacterium]|jgi:hypothetical protein
MALRAAALAVVLFAAGPASAREFAVRTAGTVTAIALDLDSVLATGHYRTGWTYEFYRERNPLLGERTQITGVLRLVNCKTLLSRRLKVAHYLADGRTLRTAGPEPAWTEAAAGSNAELAVLALCRGPDPDWARRKADTVFRLYRQVWR